MLKVLFYNLRTSNINLKESINVAVDQVLTFWKKADIPTQQPIKCFIKLEELYKEYIDVLKNKDSSSNTRREDNFSDLQKQLFDIAHGNAMNKINEQRRMFLLDQRFEQRYSISNLTESKSEAQSIESLGTFQ